MNEQQDEFEEIMLKLPEWSSSDFRKQADGQYTWGDTRRAFAAWQSAMNASISGWISVKDRLPDKTEPVVYAKPKASGRWYVGIAYWTVSETWNPEANSSRCPEGFTHWMPLPEPPNEQS